MNRFGRFGSEVIKEGLGDDCLVILIVLGMLYFVCFSIIIVYFLFWFLLFKMVGLMLIKGKFFW